MKRIEVVIQPWRLDDIRDALLEINVKGMTVYEGHGFGSHRHSELYRGAEYAIEFVSYIVLVVYVSDKMCSLAVQQIRNATKVNEGKARSRA
jgi:nitrogen regulatory protein P-II 1